MKHSYLLTNKTELHDVVSALDKGGIGFIAFVDTGNKLLGILTDGDLRRSILKKTTNLLDIINRKPETMPDKSTRTEIVARLKKLHRRHMPLIDAHGVLTSVFSLDEIEFVARNNHVVVMAGGLGSRLGELTKHIPKPMLLVGDRPMLQCLVEQFRDQGFSKFVFCLNYKKEVIQEYFGNGKRFGISIDYVFEEKSLGTAGALSLLNKDKILEDFFVVNADVLTNMDFCDLIRFHTEKFSFSTMCVRQYEQRVPYGVVSANTEHYITEIKEKPTSSYDVNAGIYVMSPKALLQIPHNEYLDMPSLFESFIEKKHSCAMYRINDYWVDIGRKEDLAKANEDINIMSFRNEEKK